MRTNGILGWGVIVGKGSNRRAGANDNAFRRNADATGWPPESPTLRSRAGVVAVDTSRTVTAWVGRVVDDAINDGTQVLRDLDD